MFNSTKKDMTIIPEPGQQYYPLLPLRDVVIFPNMVVPLFVGRDKSIRALEHAMSHQKEIFLSSQKDAKIDDPLPKDIYSSGTISSVLQLLKLPDGTVKALIEGKERGKIVNFVDIENPVELGKILLPNSFTDIVVSGSYAYVGAGASGLRVIDVSVRSNPREIGFFDTEGFTSLITLRIKNKDGEYSIAGTMFGKGDPRIVRVNTFLTEAIPEGNILFMHNYDKPGVIGNIGKTLGKSGINIAKMHLSRQKTGGVAISLIHVDEPVSSKVLEKLEKTPHIISVKQITL